MTTKITLTNQEIPPKIIKGNETCKNGHKWNSMSTRWRYRIRPNRKGHAYTGWERDCLICKSVSKGKKGSGLKTQTWIPGATNG